MSFPAPGKRGKDTSSFSGGSGSGFSAGESTSQTAAAFSVREWMRKGESEWFQ